MARVRARETHGYFLKWQLQPVAAGHSPLFVAPVSGDIQPGDLLAPRYLEQFDVHVWFRDDKGADRAVAPFGDDEDDE